jgi:quercetin dioxygenase-like cupin family protein
VRILSQFSEQSVDAHGSRGFTMRGLMRSEQAHVAVAILAPGGVIGRRAATVPQLFVVVEGSGWLAGGDAERVEVAAGDAVLWEAGEEHEAGTDEGVVAVVIESEALV